MYNSASKINECIETRMYWVYPSKNPYIEDNRKIVANIFEAWWINSEIKYLFLNRHFI